MFLKMFSDMILSQMQLHVPLKWFSFTSQSKDIFKTWTPVHADKFYQRSKWVLRDLKGTKLPSICIIRLMGSSYYIAVQIFHTIGFGLFWWRSNIFWRWQEERCEGGSLLQQQLFNVIAFVYSPNTSLSLTGPGNAYSSANLLNPCLCWIKHRMICI